jgi:S1-C subfamily serine protease
MKDRESFVADLRQLAPGDTVQCVFLRNGEEKTVYVELEGPREG